MTDQTTQTPDQTLGQNFNLSVINIGAHPENDIVLVGDGVQPFHVALMVADGDFHCVLLSPEAELAIDGSVFTESPVAVNEFDRIGIGGNEIMFQSHGRDAGIRVFISRMGVGQPVEKYLVEDDQSPIVVETSTPEVSAFVDETAAFELEVVNGGPIVASFYLRVEGLPEDWVEVDPPVVNLNEGERKYVHVKVTPPRHYSATAGENDFQVVVSSPNYYGHKVEQDLRLIIEPFYAFTLGNLSPRQRRIPFRKASETTRLPITNESNKTANFNISTYDEENGCTFEYTISEEQQLTRQAIVPLNPGEVLNLPIEIAPHKKSFFAMSAKQYFFSTNVQIQEEAQAPQVTSGVAVSPPLLGWWSLLITFWVLVISAFIIFQPRIHSFAVSSGEDVIELGSSTRLEWDVSPFATRLNITDMDAQIERGQTSLTVAPDSSTTYELVAGNWLSGLVGMDYARKVTVLVVPPTPKIGVFELDRLEVDKGKPVKVRWSATEVDELILTVDEVVYPLAKGQFSGEQEYILEGDAIITLEAKNASGSELMSYFVDVKPPKIDVIEFTVWVRPTGVASASTQLGFGGGGLDTLRAFQAPDPNFPEKLVSLVPDFDSELGYRVEFYDPDRELTKGEQIMLEWDVSGVENVEIAPFTDVLPSNGVQPFFPQESMNFVMKAASGELEKIFMLPVKVFDGVPPEAPTIEFFKASPLKMVGPGVVEFAWSISGEWTNVQLSGSDGVIANNLNPIGFQDLTIAESSTIILTAFNGDLSAAQPIDIEVNPALLPIGLFIKSAYPATGRFLINEKVSFTVDFYDTELSDPGTDTYVEPEVAPTGEVLVTDGVSLCKITLPAKTCDLTFTTPGDPKEITASYAGDSVYLSASSEPYDQYISVISSTVTLTPTYYILDRDDPDNSPNTTPIRINNVSIDTGLFVRVKVSPQGAPLPSPDPGNVNLYLCEQVGSEIVPGSCNPHGFSSIEMNGTDGIADIVIESFPEAGLHAILISYSATGFEPAEWIEYDVNVAKIEIELRMDSCSDPEAFTGCVIGTSDPASTQAIFEIWRSDTTVPERLLSSLVSPVLDAFDIYEIISGNVYNWNCELGVEIDSGKNYRILDCTADFSGTPMRASTTVYVEFDESRDDNYLFDDPDNFDFPLTIKTNTLISLEASDFQNLEVGQVLDLTTASGTGGAVNLTDPAFAPITPDGQITVTSDKTGTFAIGASPAGCTVNPNGSVVTIPDITTDCPIYFMTVTAVDDPFNLSVAYAGDATHYQSESSSPLAVTVAKQDEVTLKWYQRETNYVVWYKNDLAPNTPMQIRIELGDLGVFSGNAFAGDSLGIHLDEPTCSITSGATGGYPNYTVAIANTGIGQIPRADFTMMCTTAPRTVHITASLQNTTDFEIKAGETTQQTVGILTRNSSYLNVSFIRDVDSTSMLTGSNPGTMGTLHFGEKYTLQIWAGRVWADSNATYPTRIDKINNILLSLPRAEVTFPASIYSEINWTESTCTNLGSNRIGITLNSYNVVYDFGNPDLSQPGLTDIELYNSTPCILYFENTYTPGTGNTTFSFSTNASFPCCSSSRSNIPTSLDKQTVTISSSPTTYDAFVDSSSSTMTLTVTPEIPGTALDPLNSTTFSTLFTDPISSTCGTATGAMNAGVPTLTLSPPSPLAACTGNISVEYLGNNWFQTETQAIDSEVRKHNPAVSILYKDNGGNYVTFEAPYPQMQAGDTLEMQIRVRKGADGFASTPQPSGTVYVWMEDSGGNILDPNDTTPIYSIDTTPTDVSYDAGTMKYSVSLNAASNALYTINIEDAATNIVLKYEYSGDTYYYGETGESGYLEFQAPPPSP